MYLGLDLGTSELKALLLDERHTIVGTAHAPLTVQCHSQAGASNTPQTGGAPWSR